MSGISSVSVMEVSSVIHTNFVLITLFIITAPHKMIRNAKKEVTFSLELTFKRTSSPYSAFSCSPQCDEIAIKL